MPGLHWWYQVGFGMFPQEKVLSRFGNVKSLQRQTGDPVKIILPAE